MVESKTDPKLLFFPTYGSEYPVKDTVEDQNIQSDLPTSSGPKIISAKKKRKFYDKHGNEITDPGLIQDVMQGKTVISYHEEKRGEEYHTIKK